MHSDINLVGAEKDSTEETIRRIWTTVIHPEGDLLEIDTSFLGLGGDSLAAVLCMSRMRTAFGADLDVDISDFFDERSTIRNFSLTVGRFHSANIEKYLELPKK